MNKKGKKPETNLRTNRDIKPKEKSKISISFQYLTTNKEFNFHFFNKEFRAKAQVFEQLIEFLKRLTTKTLTDISKLRKEQDCDFEILEFKQINFTPDNYNLSKNAKIHDFRFGNNNNGGNYRLLGFFEYNQSILNVIGFDFNYSSYEHG